jgi:phenylalanyl-tRNA synthetase beta chain
MKFTLSWLKQFLDTDAEIADIANSLTQIGLEVENIIDRREELKNFEIAYIRACKPHPNADKLRVCDVETKDGSLQIVCGAPNAREGIKVVLAKIGTEIPLGKFKIKESEIRSVKSYGMLCAEDELMIGNDSSGIIELDPSAIIGESFIKYYGLDDPVIDINVTPNRGDALGVYGIARDLAARGIGTLKPIEVVEITDLVKSDIMLKIDDQDASPLFLLREISNIQNQPSPDWLKRLLQNIGVKTISAAVDVTNYIAYSLGQPMHVYDRDKLHSKSFTVQLLNSREKFIALDDKEYDLEPGDLVVTDSADVQALAGIIGGRASSCDLDTQNIVLESAVFNADYITRSGRRLQIDSDSRYRFERKIDSAFTEKALNIATNLILSICGGVASQVISKGTLNNTQKRLSFSSDFFLKKTGIYLSNNEICKLLNKLGFTTVITNNIEITVPSWRHDINIAEDIVEEVLRIYGYDKVAAAALPDCEIGKIIPKDYQRISDFKRILASRGYDEVVTWSFMDSTSAELCCNELKDSMLLVNPISSDLNYMRPSIIPNLLKIASKNLARSIKDFSLFEVGPVFCNADQRGEIMVASGIRLGHDIGKNCHTKPRLLDVFDIKADLEVVLEHMGLSLSSCKLTMSESIQEFDNANSEVLKLYHPTRCAQLFLGKNVIANFGQMHPKILKHYDINVHIVAFELYLGNVPFPKAKFGKRGEYIQSDFQVTLRDYAFVIPTAQSVGEIISYVKNLDKKLIKSVDLFDIYVGDKLESGTKSIGFTVQLQSNERTLTELDLNSLTQLIVSSVQQKFNGKLREA